MSEQIREQISAFLDGELPQAETELLLKRLTRDAELRRCFGRYALIGEACRGATSAQLTLGFADRVNRAIEAEGAFGAVPALRRPRRSRLWRHAASGAVAAGVAVVAVFALQQRANTPTLADVSVARPATSRGVPADRAAPTAVVAKSGHEALSYTVPATLAETPAALPPARLTNYVFAHSEYTSFLGQRSLLSGLMAEPDAGPFDTVGPTSGTGAAAPAGAAASAPAIANPAPFGASAASAASVVPAQAAGDGRRAADVPGGP